MHYNIQINVQQVGVERDAETPVRRSSTPQPRRRITVEVLALKVVAPNEQEAYAKAKMMLEAATPKVPTGAIDGEPERDWEDEA